jgi:hypothetical protein
MGRIEDHMDGLIGRDTSLDLIEEADELLHAAPDDLAFEDVEGGEEVVEGGGCRCTCNHGHGGGTPTQRVSPQCRRTTDRRWRRLTFRFVNAADSVVRVKEELPATPIPSGERGR